MNIYDVKQLLENTFVGEINVVVAEKPDWLILKDTKLDKTFGCMRLNKRSFATLYIDTNEKYNLSNEFSTGILSGIEIQSRLTGNFYQNKFNFYSEKDMALILSAIRLSIDNNYIKLEDKIRS